MPSMLIPFSFQKTCRYTEIRTGSFCNTSNPFNAPLVHELPGRPSERLPLRTCQVAAGGPELFRRKVHPRLFRKCGDDLLVFLEKVGSRAQKICRPKRLARDSFSSRCRSGECRRCAHIAAVAPHLLHQMAAVGGGADPDVFRRRLPCHSHDGPSEIFIGGLVSSKERSSRNRRKR